MNSSSQTNNLKDILQNKIDDLERQVLSRVNSLEEGKFNPKNESEERGKIESTLTSLHQRISDLEKGTGRSPAPLPAGHRRPRSRPQPRRRPCPLHSAPLRPVRGPSAAGRDAEPLRAAPPSPACFPPSQPSLSPSCSWTVPAAGAGDAAGTAGD